MEPQDLDVGDEVISPQNAKVDLPSRLLDAAGLGVDRLPMLHVSSTVWRDSTSIRFAKWRQPLLT